MARKAGSDGAKTLKALWRAGIKRIYKDGFEAMKLRSLAEDVGIQAGSLYNYIRHKEEFLFLLLKGVLEELHGGLDEALKGIDDPMEALKRFVSFHLSWHTARKEEVFIGNMELRSLSKVHYKKIVFMRELYEKKLRAILDEGNSRGVWSVRDTQVVSYALIAALTGVCTWYRPGGRLSQQEIVDLYTEHVLNSVGAVHRRRSA
jgi:AcrR family transcriptional regulator